MGSVGSAGAVAVAYPKMGWWFDQKLKGSGEAPTRLPAAVSSLAYAAKNKDVEPVGKDVEPVGSGGNDGFTACDCGLAFAVSKTTICVLGLIWTKNGLLKLPVQF